MLSLDYLLSSSSASPSTSSIFQSSSSHRLLKSVTKSKQESLNVTGHWFLAVLHPGIHQSFIWRHWHQPNPPALSKRILAFPDGLGMLLMTGYLCIGMLSMVSVAEDAESKSTSEKKDRTQQENRIVFSQTLACDQKDHFLFLLVKELIL